MHVTIRTWQFDEARVCLYFLQVGLLVLIRCKIGHPLF